MRNKFTVREVLSFELGGVNGSGGVNYTSNVAKTNVDPSIKGIESIQAILQKAADPESLTASGKVCHACHH